jgi:hypothetical protein
VHRLLLLVVVGCLVGTGAASATHDDPQKKLTRADNARARAMLVKRGDLPGGLRVRGGSGGEEPHVDCPAVSEADLTLTGEAEGQVFSFGTAFVESGAQVYESVADANASWRRSTSAAGTQCISAVLRREYAKQGARLVSLRKIAFPRVAGRTVAYRIEARVTSAQGEVPLYLDLVAVIHSRAHATVVVGSVLAPPPRGEEVRLARLTAKRMATAMRGA